ncbi:response regulator [bacterium]|nr:MAG: response regulator [bacterium]
MEKIAANATVWMAAPSAAKGGGPAKATTVNREILRYIAIYFGGMGLLFLLLALGAAGVGKANWFTVGLILVFVAANLGLYLWAYFSTKPFPILVAQTALGGALCPVVYLLAEGILAPWWPGYAIMALSGSVAWALQSAKPMWARLVLAYYLVNLILASWLGLPKVDYYDLALRAGLIALMGVLLVQLTDILSQSLSKVYERSLQHRKAKEELKELDRLKEDFFANVSHEFRTPITLTLAPLEAALKGRYGDFGPELRGQFGIMIRNQQRLLGLINQILDISKVNAGAATLKAARIPDFNAFVQERLDSFRPAAEARKIAVRHSFDPLASGMEIYIDREKFDKILLNLLSNALKFTKEGFIEASTEIQGDRLVLKVADTGMGIRESELPHVFDRFRQAEGSSTKDFAGTGLGLALVREFARLHGGDVTVSSRYGHGTSFEVAIPVGKSHLPPNAVVDFVEEESSTSAPLALAEQQPADEAKANCEELNAEVERLRAPEKATIVCAEDNPELRYFLRDMLMDGYNVFVGANGAEALELVKKHRPDLILSDVMMPVMNGVDFCKKVREEPMLRPIPFVMLTARSMASSKLEGLEEGADDYLTKPFSESELMARVKNLISLRRQQLKLERELEAARAIQFSLLPQVPQAFAGARLDFLYHPSAELSGDFCDILPKGDWVYFYLADVTSHGTASAQVTYLLKEIFAQLVEGGAEAPALVDLVREAQRRFSSHHLIYGVALQIARFHLQSKALELLRSSAPPPLKVGGSDGPLSLKVRPSPSLSSEAPPPPEDFHPAEFVLRPGETVYFFTDGCYEFPFAGGEYGMKRFHALLGSAPDGEGWKEKILDSLAAAHGGKSFPDDLTLLKLQVE